MKHSLTGIWRATIDGFAGDIRIPGTLDEAGIGHRDAGMAGTEGPIATRLTRRVSFEGEARLSRTLDFELSENVRAFIDVERARCLRLFIDGQEAPPFEPPTLSTTQVFEVTGRVRAGAELVLLSDNSYPGLPRADIVNASAATDETQTNWNGLLGEVCLRTEEPVFIRAMRVYPRAGALDVRVDLSAARAYRGSLRFASDALAADATVPVDVPAGAHEIKARLPLAGGVRYWELGDGQRYELTAVLRREASPSGRREASPSGRREASPLGRREASPSGRREASPLGEDTGSRTVRFGLRRFGDDGTGRLALNGRRVFLRGETNCAVFPETGHPPMTVEAWLEILETYRAYGVNLVRFHSWCPPEAAFEAADRLGMLMQPELSHWNPKDALESDAAWIYYRRELMQILREYANHPSFVMLTLGNELAAGDLGHRRMDELLVLAREMDDTRLYANGSNVHYGERGCDAKLVLRGDAKLVLQGDAKLVLQGDAKPVLQGDPRSDFYTASTYFGAPLRGTMSGTEANGGRLEGHINGQYPSARVNYDGVMSRIRQTYTGPVFGFEVGQYEVLPDFDELDDFRGVTDPANLRQVQARVNACGLMPVWLDWVAATGELALLCYRAEVEAVLRTPGMSGLVLLGLQDFPGQGTALVGMLNSHLHPKPYDFARPERFAAFYRDALPLALLARYTWLNSETLHAEVSVANYGADALCGPVRWRLQGDGFDRAGTLATKAFPSGGLTPAGTLEVPLASIRQPTRLDLTLELENTDNRYPIWVYPDEPVPCPDAKPVLQGDGVVVAENLAQALPALAAGARVFLDPPADAPLRAVPCHFSTDFWSLGTFPCQSGTMGQYIDATHPVFRSEASPLERNFPTEKHTNWQWWPMANRPAVRLPAGLRPIVAQLDSFTTLRPLAQLFECRVGPGRLLFSSMALRALTDYPEAQALLNAIYRYMESDQFHPDQSLAPADLEQMFEG